jgi:LysM repeat protein
VRAGDTLGVIAARVGTSPAELARINGIADVNHVVEGQVLRLPGGPPTAGQPAPIAAPGEATHTVRPGETVGGIAARSGTTVAAIAQLNAIKNANLVVAGQVLRLPAEAVGTDDGPPPPSRAEVAALLDAAAARHGVARSLLRAVAWQESGWNQSLSSPAGAIGVMQVMPETAAWAGPALLGRAVDPLIASDNVDVGAALLAHLIRTEGGVRAALAGYNQGPASVDKNGLFKETRAYVEAVLAQVGTV